MALGVPAHIMLFQKNNIPHYLFAGMSPSVQQCSFSFPLATAIKTNRIGSWPFSHNRSIAFRAVNLNHLPRFFFIPNKFGSLTRGYFLLPIKDLD